MKSVDPEKELAAALRAADVVVSYAPLPDEPDAEAFLKKSGFSGAVVKAPQDKNFSPHDFATALHTIHEDKKVCILVPGRKFDAEGTRHGRGGGWYDRFLAAVPKKWLKIGVALPHHLSSEKLERKSHDQPMDYVLVCSDEWRATASPHRI